MIFRPIAGNTFHPAVIESSTAVGQGHHKGRNAVPGAAAEAFRLCPATGDPDLTFGYIAGVLDGVFVLFHQVGIAGLSYRGYADFFI